MQINKDIENQILLLYKNGKSIKNIHKTFSFHEKGVRRILINNGIKIRNYWIKKIRKSSR